MKNSRVVVVDNLANGTSKVTEDFHPSPFFTIADGHQMAELWFSEKITTLSSAPSDIQKQFSNDLEPGAKRFIRSIFPPFSKVKQYANELGFSVDKKFLMHNTTTIDFAVVLKGQIELLTENDSILLKAGDCIVQKATVHSWVNPGAEPTEMIFVMIGVDVPASYRAQHIEFKVPVTIDYPSKKNMR
jgi:quercetin dioxygenase-like cupin family protein